ncbi:multifunctional procollagen lysine hydroxylase and glycosyltransferase LH3-like [Corticium candelabrum]|uniref:multifunctional procollagen lysine hydroxylase and glycosyltransferase LH3-like n=1 Tax=Corticium candelabrum TaxID=121492 RepID=UPI002E26B669|nr:multifunctional procollagen lysine hydroxylase and glycosyltransferase LH3-like [Corticium candelabrum]
MMQSTMFVICLTFVILCQRGAYGESDTRFVIFGVASDRNDGFDRFVESAVLFDLNVTILGMGQQWKGLGQKVHLLIPALEPYKDDNNVIVMYTDSYDVVFLAGQDAILSKFSDFKSNLVFSAEETCWPEDMAEKHPRTTFGKRYLNSGGFIGYAPAVYEALTFEPISYRDNDQELFQKVYVNENFRNKHNMKLDHRAYIFMNLKDSEDEVKVMYDKNRSWIRNVVYDTEPVLIHGPGIGRRKLLTLGNYVPNRWTSESGCTYCDTHMFSLQHTEESEFPDVLMAVFSIRPTPFFGRFLEKVAELNYPKNRISLRLYVVNEYHDAEATNWVTGVHQLGYHNVTLISSNSNWTERECRNDALQSCVTTNCSYYFVIGSSVMLLNRDTLRLLIEQNRTILAPVISQHNKYFSNFWGDVSNYGFYKRSDDYIDIVTRNVTGVWNVPHIQSVYLVKGSAISRFSLSYNGFTFNPNYDPEMAFARRCMFLTVFMHVTNRHYFGRLVDYSSYTTNHLHNDMYDVIRNELDWREEYIHPDYWKTFKTILSVPMPCPDVYVFPLISKKFAKELIEEIENYGQWSVVGRAKNDLGDDSHVEPHTVDLRQIGFDDHWKQIFKNYVQPVHQHLFSNYQAELFLGSVLKFTEGKLSWLLPEKKSYFSSTVFLSTVDVDYQGDGCRFMRHDCKTKDPSVGHVMLHPGITTHRYERLNIQQGTSYLAVSFIN